MITSDPDLKALISDADYPRLQELRAAIDARVEQLRDEHIQRAADLGLTLVVAGTRRRRKARRNGATAEHQ